MKNILTALIFVALALSGLNGLSQNANRLSYLRERMARANLNEIQLKFKLDEATFEKFRPIYMKYEEEIAGIDIRKMSKLMKVNTDSLSAADAEMLVMNQLQSAKKIITVREKYYKEFRTVLSPQQVVKFYQIEAGLRKEVTEELRNRKLSR